MANKTIVNYPLLSLIRVGVDADNGASFIDLSAHLQTVSIHRGPQRNGPALTADVGTLSLTFRETGEGFWDDPVWRRNQTVTVACYNANGSATYQPLFTGKVMTVTVEPDTDRDERERDARIITVTATDDVDRHTNKTLSKIITVANSDYVLEPGHLPWVQMVTNLMTYHRATGTTFVFERTQPVIYEL